MNAQQISAPLSDARTSQFPRLFDNRVQANAQRIRQPQKCFQCGITLLLLDVAHDLARESRFFGQGI